MNLPLQSGSGVGWIWRLGVGNGSGLVLSVAGDVHICTTQVYCVWGVLCIWARCTLKSQPSS